MKRSTHHRGRVVAFACIAIAIIGLLLMVLSGIEPTPKPMNSPERASPAAGDEDEWLERASWFYAQRAYPLEAIPAGARLRGIENWEREEARLSRLREIAAGRPAAAAQLTQRAQLTWTALGPAPIGQGQTFGNPRAAVSGRVSMIAFDPRYNGSTNQTIYIGAAQGGLWRSRDDGATWTPLTDDQPSLATGAIAIDPVNPNILYVGTGEAHQSGDSYYGAGLLKSIDGGATWARVSGPVSMSDPKLPAFLNASFHAIAIDPASPATLFAATETGFVSSASGAAAFPPLGDRGIWKSTDGGMNWRNVNPSNTLPLDKAGTDVLLDPRDPKRVFAGIWQQGIYRSNLGGEPGTWERLGGGLPDSDIERIKLAAGPPFAPAVASSIYAVIGKRSTSRPHGLFRSTDNGATWSRANLPSSTVDATFYALALAVDPVDANVVYFGTLTNTTNTGGTLWRSRDGGQTWADISLGDGASGGLHADTHWIAIHPANRNLLFTANDGGVWRTEEATASTVSWRNLNQGLNITQFYTLALHPTDANILLGGTQDNGTDRFDGGLTWFHARGGDGGAALIDQSNPLVMYHTFQNLNNRSASVARIGPEVSFDGGATWTRRGCFGCAAQAGSLHPADRLSDFAPMAAHTGFSGEFGNVIYFGAHRLYRSADRGVTWTGLGASADGFGADLTKNLPDPNFGSGFPSYISAIAAHPVLNRQGSPPGEVVWAGTGDGLVQVTTNAGALSQAVFTNVTRGPLPNRYITDIALDPHDARRAIVSYSGFNSSTPSTPGHVFETDDQGARWRDISGNLPDLPANSIAIDPLSPGTIFIGNDIGVFRTVDGGAVWERLSNGMPGAAVLVVRYHAASRSLVAATHGRGVYRLQLPPAAVSVSAASYLGSQLAPESIVAMFGAGLATATLAASTIPLPTELAGTRVFIRDSTGTERAAPLFFVAPSQINYQMPPGAAIGLAAVKGISGDGTIASGVARIDAVAPGLFTSNADGQGVAAAVAVRVKADGTQTFEPVAQFDPARNRYVPLPIDLGPPGETVVLVLFGTGLRHRAAQAAVRVALGGPIPVEAPVQYAGATPGLIGLDQINAVLPRSLIGQGEIDVLAMADGRAANPVRIHIR
ncbi:MAG: hypothetical protein ACKVX9_00360 [Blastocatellia bacterium]